MFTTTKSPTLSPSFSLGRISAISSTKPKFWNIISMKEPNSPTYLALTNQHRNLSVSCSSQSEHGSHKSSIQGGEAFFRGVLESMQFVYLDRNPTAKAILDLVHSVENNSLCYDHLAFRTFGVNGYGFDSMASFFLDYGYWLHTTGGIEVSRQKLRALWFSPPADSLAVSGSCINGPLPRIFISELLVDQMSPKTQEIIRKFGDGNKQWRI